MNKTKIGIFTIGNKTTASTRYRVLAYLDYLREEGLEVEIFCPLIYGLDIGRLVEILRDIARIPAFDIVFIQKKCYPPFFSKIIRKVAKRIVFDFDDAIYLPPPGKTFQERYEKNFAEMIRIADGIICGNAHLESVARQYNLTARTLVLQSGIDTLKFAPKEQRMRTGNEMVIGWVGYSDNHIYLKRFHSAWQTLNKKYPSLIFRVVSDKPLTLDGVNIENIKWELAEEVDCFDGIDIGIMPLEDTEWARGKCAFKAIQYLACGVPSVVSPVGENVNLINDGINGFLAGDTNEWVEKISRLIEDADLRKKFAYEGRKTVEEKYSLKVLAPTLSAFLKSVSAK